MWANIFQHLMIFRVCRVPGPTSPCQGASESEERDESRQFQQGDSGGVRRNVDLAGWAPRNFRQAAQLYLPLRALSRARPIQSRICKIQSSRLLWLLLFLLTSKYKSTYTTCVGQASYVGFLFWDFGEKMQRRYKINMRRWATPLIF